MPDLHEDSPPAPNVLVLYATETGTAEEAARRIGRACRRIRFTCRVVSVDTYPLEDLIAEKLVVFVVSTSGDGAEPRPMRRLWKSLLRSDLPNDLFEDLRFAVFGLGDTAYDKFCWPAKLLERRLESLGATVISPRGEGDEQHRIGIEGGLLPWIRTLRVKLLALYPSNDVTLSAIHGDERPPPRVSLVDVPLEKDPEHQSQGPAVSLEPSTGPGEVLFPAVVACNRRITTEGWEQDIRHIALQFPNNTSINYAPGDALAIYPQAAEEDVAAFLTEMGWANTGDEPFTVHPSSTDDPPPSHAPKHRTTLRALFTSSLDFNAVPRRAFFELAHHFATDPDERAKLIDFCAEDGEGADDMWEYAVRTRRTIREVLADFHSVRIPREYVFDLFPPLRSRSFSIASAPATHPREVHLCVAIVRYRTKLRIVRRGVCTSYLARLREGDKLSVAFEKGTMRLPPSADTPVICIGPGTGLAPMRSVLAARVAQGATDNTLYFGCRSSCQDEHYGEEWATLAQRGVLRYRLAASRDGPPGTARTYVQHLIAQDAKLVWHALRAGAYVYLSGSAGKMPRAVKDAMREAIRDEGAMSDTHAAEWLKQMDKEGRWFEECWN